MNKTVILGIIGWALMSGFLISTIIYKKRAIRWREQCYAGYDREVQLEKELELKEEEA